MTNFTPIFPLNIVVYPGENLHLHIFEPRYKQLVNECFSDKKPFGIITVIDQSVNEMGTLVEVTEISKTYENGNMDIKTRGLEVFRVLEIIKKLPEKLYSGAIVNYPVNERQASRSVMQSLINAIRELHRLLKVEKDFVHPDAELSSYDVAHHVGLSLQEEYELLQLMHESQRQEYIKRHLSKTIPLMAEMESLREKIKQNGHFKNLSGFSI